MKTAFICVAFASLLASHASAQSLGSSQVPSHTAPLLPFDVVHDHADSITFLNPAPDFTTIRTKAMQSYTPEFRSQFAAIITAASNGLQEVEILKYANTNRQLFDSTGKPFIEDPAAMADDEASDISTQQEFEDRFGTIVAHK